MTPFDKNTEKLAERFGGERERIAELVESILRYFEYPGFENDLNWIRANVRVDVLKIAADIRHGRVPAAWPSEPTPTPPVVDAPGEREEYFDAEFSKYYDSIDFTQKLDFSKDIRHAFSAGHDAATARLQAEHEETLREWEYARDIDVNKLHKGWQEEFQLHYAKLEAELARSEKRCAELVEALMGIESQLGDDGVCTAMNICTEALTKHNEALAQSQRDAGKVE